MPWIFSLLLAGALAWYHLAGLCFTPIAHGESLRASLSDGTLTETFPEAASWIGEDGGLHLRPGQRIHTLIERAPGARAVHVEADIQADSIHRGDVSWKAGRIAIGFRDDQGRENYRVPHYAAVVEGTKPWNHIRATLLIPEATTRLHLLAQNSGDSGVFSLRSLSLTQYRIRASHPWIVAGLLGLALALGGWIVHTGTLKGHVAGRVTLLLAMIIVMGTLVPQPWIEWGLHRLDRPEPQPHSMEHAAPAPSAPGEIPPPTQALTPAASLLKPETHKQTHFILFLALGLSAAVACRKAPTLSTRTCLAALILFAGITELLQGISITRTPRLLDWGIDLLGATLGVGLIWWLSRIHRSMPDAAS